MSLSQGFSSYGIAGTSIVTAIFIHHVCRDRHAAGLLIRGTIDEVIDTAIQQSSDDEFWEGSNSQQLPFDDFLERIAVPHVINILISQDMNIDIAQAFNLMQRSSNFGMAVHDEGSASEEVIKSLIKSHKVHFIRSLLHSFCLTKNH